MHIFLLIFLFAGLFILNTFFIALSASLMHAKEARINDPEFKIFYGKNSALSQICFAGRNALTAQACRLIVLFGVIYLVEDLFASAPLLALTDSATLIVALKILTIFLIALLLLASSQVALSFAYSKPERTLCYLSPFASPCLLILAPVGKLAKIFSELLSRNFSLSTPVEALNTHDVEELIDFAQQDQGTVAEKNELSMLKGVFELSNTRVEEVMTPRHEIEAINVEMSLKEFLESRETTDFSRLLVIGEELDDVKGILMIRDLVLDRNQKDSSKSVADFIRPVINVGCDQLLVNLLTVFRLEKAHFAVVRDEHGGVDGIITMEDVLEEIVGDIFDEYDDPEDEQETQTTVTGDLLVDGGTPLDDLNEEYDLKLPEGEYDTIAGFVIYQLGKMPANGEIIDFEDFRFIVEEFADNRIVQIRIILNKALTDAAATGLAASSQKLPAS